MINEFDQTTIEDELRLIATTLSVSDKVYTSRPSSTTSTNNDFVVAKVSGKIIDNKAYGECVCSFHLFAKDIAGFKNGKKLSVMYKKLSSGLPQWQGKLLFEDKPIILSDMPDDYGYHVRIINIKTIIKI
jgi:hypothetical protein